MGDGRFSSNGKPLYSQSTPHRDTHQSTPHRDTRDYRNDTHRTDSYRQDAYRHDSRSDRTDTRSDIRSDPRSVRTDLHRYNERDRRDSRPYSQQYEDHYTERRPSFPSHSPRSSYDQSRHVDSRQDQRDVQPRQDTQRDRTLSSSARPLKCKIPEISRNDVREYTPIDRVAPPDLFQQYEPTPKQKPAVLTQSVSSESEVDPNISLDQVDDSMFESDVKVEKIEVFQKPTTIKKAKPKRISLASESECDSKPSKRPKILSDPKKDDFEDSDTLQTEPCITLPLRKHPLPLSQIHQLDRTGRTLLFRYITLSDFPSCLLLIKSGASPHTRDHAAYTPLHEAALKGNSQIAILLLQHGADVNAVGGDSDTPLHDAASANQLEVCEVLLEFGADHTLMNKHGETCYDVANVDIRMLMDEWREWTKQADFVSDSGETALHQATSSSDSARIVKLLKHGSDINSQNTLLQTPLCTAVSSLSLETAALLLSYGADPNLSSPLQLAVDMNSQQLICLLLSYSAVPLTSLTSLASSIPKQTPLYTCIRISDLHTQHRYILPPVIQPTTPLPTTPLPLTREDRKLQAALRSIAHMEGHPQAPPPFYFIPKPTTTLAIPKRSYKKRQPLPLDKPPRPKGTREEYYKRGSLKKQEETRRALEASLLVEPALLSPLIQIPSSHTLHLVHLSNVTYILDLQLALSLSLPSGHTLSQTHQLPTHPLTNQQKVYLQSTGLAVCLYQRMVEITPEDMRGWIKTVDVIVGGEKQVCKREGIEKEGSEKEGDGKEGDEEVGGEEEGSEKQGDGTEKGLRMEDLDIYLLELSTVQALLTNFDSIPKIHISLTTDASLSTTALFSITDTTHTNTDTHINTYVDNPEVKSEVNDTPMADAHSPTPHALPSLPPQAQQDPASPPKPFISKMKKLRP